MGGQRHSGGVPAVTERTLVQLAGLVRVTVDPQLLFPAQQEVGPYTYNNEKLYMYEKQNRECMYKK